MFCSHNHDFVLIWNICPVLNQCVSVALNQNEYLLLNHFCLNVESLPIYEIECMPICKTELGLVLNTDLVTSSEPEDLPSSETERLYDF